MRSNRVLLAVAIVSVGLNLLLVGMLLGRMAGPGMDGRPDPMIGVRHLLTGLPADRAETLAPYYRSYVSALRPRFREIRSVQHELREAMLTEPLDQTALTAALTRFQTHLSDSQRAAREAFVTLAGAMTLEERRQLVERMSEPLHRSDRPLPPPERLPPP